MLPGLDDMGCRMNVGKTLCAQVMEFVPWKTFGRIIDRHHGDTGVRTLGCADLFRVMAFAQLTWRESLRDIEVCLAANQAKLFHMGLKSVHARWTHLGCPESAGLAHLSRTGDVTDYASPRAVYRGLAWHRAASLYTLPQIM